MNTAIQEKRQNQNVIIKEQTHYKSIVVHCYKQDADCTFL